MNPEAQGALVELRVAGSRLQISDAQRQHDVLERPGRVELEAHQVELEAGLGGAEVDRQPEAERGRDLDVDRHERGPDAHHRFRKP